MSERVYCKDCRFIYLGIMATRCQHPTADRYPDHPVDGPFKLSATIPERKNKNLDCPDYRAKWWKPWRRRTL